jgi:5-methylcytosine-specific restriction endonuclease McrA
MSKKRQDYMRQADQLFSRIIRERDGRCMHCGTGSNLQCAHIISRSYKSIRTLEDNAVALCRSCHVRFTHRPLEWEAWVQEQFPGRWERLKVEALKYERVDWQGERDRLKAILENLEEAA